MKSDNLKKVEISKTVEGKATLSLQATVTLAGHLQILLSPGSFKDKDHPHPSSGSSRRWWR